MLVASGDLTMGGRTAPNGTVSYTHIDHTYANSVPGATLTPENPLAGIDEIARQVRMSGVNRVDGDVVIDDRLFELAPKGPSVNALSFNAPNLEPWPRPITINDNLIDVQVAPGKLGEAPKVVKWRPKFAPYHLEMRAKTVAAGKPTTLDVSPQTDGPVVVSGNIAADAGKQLRVAAVDDPSAFARTALIEALRHAGVSVVFAKVGTVGLPDFVSVRVVDNESLGGYMKVKPGQFHVFYLVVNSASAKNVEEALKIFNDVNDIAAILQEDASIQGGLHRATNNSGKQHLLKARQNKMRAGILGSGLLLALMHPSAWKGNSAKSWPQAAVGGIMLVAERVSARKRKRVLGRRRRYYGLAHHRNRPRALQLRYRLPVHPW